MTIRLMLADDHRMLREGLRRSMTEEGFDVVGEAQDGVEAVHLAEQLIPDVILMDVSMPNCDGVEACRQVKSHGTPSKIVMLTMHADKEVLTNAIRAGASGYLIKDCSTREIADAVRMAANGDTVLSPQLAKSMLDEVRRLDERVAEDERMVTKREEEVLQLIARGYMYKEIALRLGISVKTVEAHVSSVLRKLQLSSRHELARWATGRGLA